MLTLLIILTIVYVIGAVLMTQEEGKAYKIGWDWPLRLYRKWRGQ